MLVAIGGWTVALLALGIALATWRFLAARLERVARASHELRGGVCAVRLGLAAAGRAGDLSLQRVRALELDLCRAARALEDLDGGGPLRGQGPVAVRALLADSVEASRAEAAARGLALRLCWSGEDAVVAGDRIGLVQATRNLISNAIEHGGGAIAPVGGGVDGQSGGEVRGGGGVDGGRGPVEVRGRLDGDVVRLEVIDSGPGLPAPVAQLARRARRGRGSRGRGLAIAAEIARAHGGRLAAAPSERGARVVLELPGARARDRRVEPA
jgi:signal transduction histidine kinase